MGWDGSSWIPGQCSPMGWGCLIPLLPVPVPHGAIPKLGCEVPKRTKGSFWLPSKRVSRGIALKAPQHAVLTVGFAGGSSLCTPPAVARGAWAPFGAGRDEDEDVGMMSACRNSLWRGARPQLARLSFALVLFLLKCLVLLPIPHLAPWTRILPSAALLIPRGLFTRTEPLLLFSFPLLLFVLLDVLLREREESTNTVFYLSTYKPVSVSAWGVPGAGSAGLCRPGLRARLQLTAHMGSSARSRGMKDHIQDQQCQL